MFGKIDNGDLQAIMAKVLQVLQPATSATAAEPTVQTTRPIGPNTLTLKPREETRT